MLHHKIKGVPEEAENSTEEKTEILELEKQLAALKKKRIARDKKYEFYFSKEKADININCVYGGRYHEIFTKTNDPVLYLYIRQEKDLIGSNVPVCIISKLSLRSETGRRETPLDVGDVLLSGDFGKGITLFQWVTEFYLNCISLNHKAFGRHVAEALKESVEKFGKTKETKMTIIIDFKKIKHFLQKFQGNIVLHEIQQRKFEIDVPFKRKNISGYTASENKLFIEFLPESREAMIVDLKLAIKKLFGIKGFASENKILKDCLNFFLASKWGVGSVVENVQEQILYDLAPDVSKSYLRENFLPLGYRNNSKKTRPCLEAID